MVTNSPTNAGDMGSIPGLERFHMPGSKQAPAPQLLNPHAASTEACMPRVSVLRDTTTQWEACT